MPRFGRTESLDVHLTVEAATRYKLDELIIFEQRQYRVVSYVHQPDGTVKMTIVPTGLQDPTLN